MKISVPTTADDRSSLAPATSAQSLRRCYSHPCSGNEPKDRSVPVRGVVSPPHPPSQPLQSMPANATPLQSQPLPNQVPTSRLLPVLPLPTRRSLFYCHSYSPSLPSAAGRSHASAHRLAPAHRTDPGPTCAL